MKKLLAKLLPRWRSGLVILLLLGVLGVNFVAYQQARAMLRFVRAGERTVSPEKLSLFAKARVLFTGVTLTRPENRVTPVDVGLAFETRRFAGAQGIELEAWFVPAPRVTTNGVVLLFHGYGASKAALLAPAKEFHALGWAALLVDFHGSGGSAGDTTSIGWREAEDVRAAFAEAARLAPGRPRVLYGPSMGAVACLRAVHALGVQPDALILECAFDRLLTTVRHRFDAMRVPSWPLAELLVFWGGQQSGYDGFAHNPVSYAASVRCPTLLMHGENDPRVRVAEVQGIHAALNGPKALKIFPGLSHQSYVETQPAEWRAAVQPWLAPGTSRGRTF